MYGAQAFKCAKQPIHHPVETNLPKLLFHNTAQSDRGEADAGRSPPTPLRPATLTTQHFLSPIKESSQSVIASEAMRTHRLRDLATARVARGVAVVGRPACEIKQLRLV